jgi:hypothetical protein
MHRPYRNVCSSLAHFSSGNLFFLLDFCLLKAPQAVLVHSSGGWGDVPACFEVPAVQRALGAGWRSCCGRREPGATRALETKQIGG